MKIPFVDLLSQYESIRPDIDGAITKVIQQSAFIGGSFVNDFEKEYGRAYGVKHVIGCGNGTDSLYIIMKMMGIGSGDEVITAANSWISSSETITQTGARAVFVDIHPEYYSMDESRLEEKITNSTRAVIAVHLQGQMCDIETIRKICDRRKIYLIEDCAQSHFSEFKNKRAGLFGHAGSFSFYPGKNLGAYGDAGCIITNDDALAEKCRMYSHHGALKKHQHQMEGINSRLDGLQAAILSAKLPHLAGWTESRIRCAALYNKWLDGIPEIILPRQRPDTKHTWHLYVIRCKKRKQLTEFLSALGIETTIHYPVILPNLNVYQYLGYTAADFPVANSMQEEILSLPLFPEMKESQIQFVSDSIKTFYKKNE